MKILILTSTANRHKFFSSKIVNYFSNDDVSIIQEPKGSKGKGKNKIEKFLKNKFKITLIKNLMLNFLFKFFIKKIADEKKQAESEYFDFFKYDDLDVIDIVEPGKTINDNKYVRKIKRLSPDIIVVMGTSLIKEEIINIPKLGILNLHTGVSPYYRGGMTNFWPFIFNELEYCGVTIHELSTGIDSGDIIYRGFINVEKEDTYSSINCKAIVHGGELMIKAIDDLKYGELKSIKQENIGKLFFNRNYNGFYAYKYFNILKKRGGKDEEG